MQQEERHIAAIRKIEYLVATLFKGSSTGKHHKRDTMNGKGKRDITRSVLTSWLFSHSDVNVRIICKSRLTFSNTLERWTLTTNSTPEFRRVPLYTCPIETDATGSRENDENTSPMLMFNSCSIMERPNSPLKGGTASCSFVRPFAYFAGSRSVRVLSAWQTLMNMGPKAVINSNKSWLLCWYFGRKGYESFGLLNNVSVTRTYTNSVNPKLFRSTRRTKSTIINDSIIQERSVWSSFFNSDA